MTLSRMILLLTGFCCFMSGILPLHGYCMDPRFTLDPAQFQKGGDDPARRGKAGRKKMRVSRRHALLLKKTAASEAAPVALQLSSSQPVTARVDDQHIRSFWDKLVPAAGTSPQPLVFKTESFDLSVDPVRYPMLVTADGKKMLLDRDNSLPPLVRTLIQGKDPSVRIVTASAADGRRLLAALLGAGGFYSVEEQSLLTFGNDPKLTVRADFKVERSAESVMKNDVVLVNASQHGMPSRLSDYLKGQGFEVLEPFADEHAAAVPLRHRVIHVAPERQDQTVDMLLELLAIPVERQPRVELFSAAESGIALSVSVDRSFYRLGKHYVVARFNGDPITYTLVRLLETKGYRVVILEPQDDFRAVATKLLARMDLPSHYAPHVLFADAHGRYALETSGFMLENSASNGGSVLVTDRQLEQPLRELLYDYGYQVQDR